jgi:shikimate dehydrogenase
MRRFGLIGYPLGHSFSKKYFAEKFTNEHITDCIYENYPLTDILLLENLLVSESELCGLNVTIPYKSAVIRFLDVIEPEANEIGAVNVLKIKRIAEKIILHGYNSDITGIRDSLFPYIKKGVNQAIVLGTGGSSRAVCHVLKRFGLKVVNISRNKKPGVITYSEIDLRLIKKTQIIVNTTPLGMFPDIDTKPDLDYDMLNKKHILFDLVYNPEKTSFLKSGEDRGCEIIGGLKMLHSQAERAWEIWNDQTL